MDVQAWIQAAGPDEDIAQAILAMLIAPGDPTRLQVRHEGERLVMTHQTVVLVAHRP